jgi:ABC-type transport system involved in cytochrome c biogenesis ATPase subunit
MSDAAPPPVTLVQAEGLVFAYGEAPVFDGLSFAIRPGLTLVRGGDGRGKTTLLRLVAGDLAPAAGLLRRHAASLFFESPSGAATDAVTAADWLASQAACFDGWDDALQQRLAEGFGLLEHLPKPLAHLSAGSRRKVGLVAAAASGAQLTLLDTPFAALDMPSRRLLASLLAESAEQAGRAWVVADGEWPEGLQGVPLAGRIDLGD